MQKLLDGRKPFIMVTDPPYGVRYEPEWRNKAARSSTGMGNRHLGAGACGQVTNDPRAAWSTAYALSQATVAYVWHAGLFAGIVQQGLQAAGFETFAQIIWAKTRAAIGRGHYHWAHEPCWAAVRKGCTADFRGDRKNKTLWGDVIDNFSAKDPTQYAIRLDAQTVYTFPAECTTVWTIPHDKQVEGGHSTQKPIECMARPIRLHGGKGDDVYDPFLGTGTTMAAAEQLGRVCYGFEISPAYTAVILQRLKDAGMEPQLKAASA